MPNHEQQWVIEYHDGYKDPLRMINTGPQVHVKNYGSRKGFIITDWDLGFISQAQFKRFLLEFPTEFAETIEYLTKHARSVKAGERLPEVSQRHFLATQAYLTSKETN